MTACCYAIGYRISHDGGQYDILGWHQELSILSAGFIVIYLEDKCCMKSTIAFG
jgi:hypothetical protein